MAGAWRVLLGIGLAAVLAVGAAGLSGFLTLPDDCTASELPEGTIESSRARLWPPAAGCVYWAPAGAEADGRFIYTDEPTEVRHEGSAVAFVAILGLGLLIAALTIRAWPQVPRPLRLVAATGLAFAALGALPWRSPPVTRPA